MKETRENKSVSEKPSRSRYIIAAGCLLLIVAAMVLIVFTHEQKPDPASEKIIREAAARQLDKNPNELTDKDFLRITELEVAFWEAPNIKFLSRFINLRQLYIHYKELNPWYIAPVQNRSRFKMLLSRFGYVDSQWTNSFELRPIKKLSKLEKLVIMIPVNDIVPLASLTSLKELKVISGNFWKVDSYGKFRVIREDLDIKPLEKLSNLQTLSLSANSIKNLDSITKLEKLKQLTLNNPITKQQEEYLQQALPELKIDVFTDDGSIIIRIDERWTPR